MEYVITTVLILFSAMFSGLTLGFFSLNLSDLRRKAELGNRNAIKVLRLRSKGNQLLTTLLIGNVAVNSVLAVFLGSLTNGLVASLVATALIVIFGEIIPQATFARYALQLGAQLSGITRFFMIILYPLSFPIAWILDQILGGETPTVYSRRELIKMIEHHEDLGQSDIDEDEEKIVRGALSYSHKKVKDVLTPRKELFALTSTDQITQELLNTIKEEGTSRIPVFGAHEVVEGILYTKDLIDPKLHEKTVGEIARKNIVTVSINAMLDEVLNLFRRTRNHLFIVTNNAREVVGIITIEDILEEIIGKEIMDEFDTED